MTKQIIYAGIGSRKTPTHIIEAMATAAEYLATQNVLLRSGGAPGADVAFSTAAENAGGPMEIFLPYNRFNGFLADNVQVFAGSTIEARAIASEFHPKWDVLSDDTRDYLGRNVYQVLGRDLDRPADFVLCWTPLDDPRGGTKHTCRVAAHYGVPVFNFASASQDMISDAILEIIG